MPLILGTNSIKDTGFNVANSLRFDDGSSDALTRTQSSSPTNDDKGTISFWFKSSFILSGNNQYFFTVFTDSNTRIQMFLKSTGSLRLIQKVSASTTVAIETNRLFRDPSAWYHCCLAIDTTQNTSSDRIKLYINGVQETSLASSTYPTQNENTQLVKGTDVSIGGYNNTNDFFNGYLAEVVLIDGQQLDPTSFGEFDSDSPTVWKPIDVSGLTFGTNGFYLDFEDSSALGNDAAGSNNFTVNNLTAVDQSTDTCTNNFATMNPLDNYYANSTFAEGNLKVTQGSSRYAWNLSTIAVTAGKWYAEAKLTTSGSYAFIGITDRSPLQNLNDILGSGAYDYSIYQYNGDLFNNAGLNPANDDENYAASYASGDIIGIALDLDNNKLYFSKNGAWSDGSGSWDSSTFNSSTGAITITAPASTTHGHYFFASGDYESGQAPTFEWNFGGTQSFTISSGNADDNGYGNFEYDVPTGYYALNTKNLAEFG